KIAPFQSKSQNANSFGVGLRRGLVFLLPYTARNATPIFKPPARSRTGGDRRVFQAFCDIGGLQRVDQFVEIAVNHAIEVMKRQADAMVGHAVLREIIGTDFFFTSTGTDLAATLCTVFFGFFALFSLQQPR